MSEIRVAAANVCICHDKAKNLERVLGLIADAKQQKVDIVVMPEAAIQGYADFALSPGTEAYRTQLQYYQDEAEPIPGPSTDLIAQAISGSGLYVQIGMAEIAPKDGRIYNSVALIGPEGLVGSYRKTHNQAEHPYFATGNAATVFDLPWGKVASMICYDVCFPELARWYALQGATIVLMSTAWPMKGHDRERDHYRRLMNLMARATAFSNQNWLVLSNHCERNVYSDGIDYFGGSQVINPEGEVVGRLEQDEGLLVCSIGDLAGSITHARTEAFFGRSLLLDRRADLYARLLEEAQRTDVG